MINHLCARDGRGYRNLLNGSRNKREVQDGQEIEIYFMYPRKRGRYRRARLRFNSFFCLSWRLPFLAVGSYLPILALPVGCLLPCLLACLHGCLYVCVWVFCLGLGVFLGLFYLCFCIFCGVVLLGVGATVFPKKFRLSIY